MTTWPFWPYLSHFQTDFDGLKAKLVLIGEYNVTCYIASRQLRGGIIIKKQENRLAPPPTPYRIFETFLNFRLICKMLTPLSYQIETFFNMKTYWWRKTPWTDILKGLFRHIYIKKGHIRVVSQAKFQIGAAPQKAVNRSKIGATPRGVPSKNRSYFKGGIIKHTL